MTGIVVGEPHISASAGLRARLALPLAQLPSRIQAAVGPLASLAVPADRTRLPGDDDFVAAAFSGDPKPIIDGLRGAYGAGSGIDPRSGRTLLHTTLSELGTNTAIAAYRWSVAPDGREVLERTHHVAVPTAELLKADPEAVTRTLAAYLALSPRDAAKHTPDDLLKALRTATPAVSPYQGYTAPRQPAGVGMLDDVSDLPGATIIDAGRQGERQIRSAPAPGASGAGMLDDISDRPGQMIIEGGQSRRSPAPRIGR